MKHGVLCDPGWRKSEEGRALVKKILDPVNGRRKKFGEYCVLVLGTLTAVLSVYVVLGATSS
jgi:hypothetical protein